LEEEGTGIKSCIRDGCESYRFNKEEVEKWIEKNGLNNTEGVEVIDGEYTDFTEDDDN
jgi:hypothetical protein